MLQNCGGTTLITTIPVSRNCTTELMYAPRERVTARRTIFPPGDIGRASTTTPRAFGLSFLVTRTNTFIFSYLRTPVSLASCLPHVFSHVAIFFVFSYLCFNNSCIIFLLAELTVFFEQLNIIKNIIYLFCTLYLCGIFISNLTSILLASTVREW